MIQHCNNTDCIVIQKYVITLK